MPGYNNYILELPTGDLTIYARGFCHMCDIAATKFGITDEQLDNLESCGKITRLEKGRVKSPFISIDTTDEAVAPCAETCFVSIYLHHDYIIFHYSCGCVETLLINGAKIKEVYACDTLKQTVANIKNMTYSEGFPIPL